jgi:hypothetical protein
MWSPKRHHISGWAMTVRPETPKKHTMKKLLLITLTSCAFAAQTIPAFADATEAEREQIELARTEMRKAVAVEEGCKTLCEEILKNEKAKKLMCEMLSKDPEAVKLIVAK